VVGYLAVTQRPSGRDVLAGCLWQFSNQHRAQANLRTAIWRINQVSSRVIVTERNLVWLGDDVEVDAQAAGQLARELIGPAVTNEFTATKLRLLEFDLLPGWDEAWLVVERERLRQLRMHALEALSRYLVGRGRYSEAIEAAISAVAAEPLRESAHAALIEVYIAEGNLSEAAREFERYETLLQEELGLQPSNRLRGLLDTSEPR
jgi:DNA-binding SARP family transcriptional activator